jgi:formate dehydrogenase assembly factor FdhD/molybdopterin-guanine dinucleotide biosynthesis protein A
MTRAEQYSLLLLAGGKSARMGTGKAELMYEGKTFLQHMLDKADALGITKFYLSGFSAPRPDVQTVWDHYPDRGPLGGIHACMQVIDTPYCLILPVDAPTLPVDILEALLSRHENREDEKVLIWEHGVRQEPLIAVYPTAMADTIENLIRDHAAPVFRAIDTWGYTAFRKELDQERPLNINTPELYKKLLGENVDDAREKETIMLHRIRGGQLKLVKDEVALEHHFTIHLHNGTSVEATCSPSHLEEFILGRRYLLDDLMQKEYPIQRPETLEAVAVDTVLEMTSELFETPGDLFQSTGCAHSCALVYDGKVQCCIEDIGRHNALDKVVGFALKNGIPLSASIIFTSGRISRDYLEKVIKSGVRIVVSRAAVTASAVALARQKNITMLGFIRRNGGNVYHMGEVSLF